jgi:hypothetical protein
MSTEEVIKALETKLEEKGFASKTDVEGINAQIEQLKTIADQTELKSSFDKLEAEIDALKAVKVEVGKDLSMTPVKKAMLENKEQISALKNGELQKVTIDVEDFTSKAVHNPTDIGNRNQLGQFEPDLSKIVRNRYFMENLFPTGTATTEYIKYVEEATILRDAKNVAACAETTHDSKVTFGIRDLQMKKLRDFTDVCIDMMDDYSFVETEIRDLVDTGVRLREDSQLLLGDGIGANLNGVLSYSSTFSATATGANYANKVADAQLIDLLVVAGAQIKAFGGQRSFMPNVIILNPVDATLLGLLKDGESNYIKMGSVNASVFRDAGGNLFVNGMLVVENANCPSNQAFVMDSTKARLYNRTGITIEFAYENRQNFEQELVTVKAMKRGNLRVRNNDANAFLHIPNIATGITAITAT